MRDNKLTFVFIFLLLSLFADLAFSQATSQATPQATPQVTYVNRYVILSPADAAGSKGVDAVIIEEKTTDLSSTVSTRNALSDYLKKYFQRNAAGQSIGVQEAFDRIKTQTIKTEIASLQNGEVKLQWISSTGLATPIRSQGCQIVRTTEQYRDASGRLAPITDREGKAVNVFYGRCLLTNEEDKKEYRGGCKNIEATHSYIITGEQETAQAYAQICDDTITPISGFSSTLSNHLALPPPSDQRFWVYIAGFLLGGLLLASLYFSGKTPISLLDIATPRLPSPKGLAAGGQTLAPFGYSEMKRELGKNQKAIEDLSKALFSNLKGSAGAKASGLIEGWTNTIGKTAKAADKFAGDVERHKSFYRAMALLAAKSGVPLSEIKSLAKYYDRYDKKDHETLGRIFARLEKTGGRDLLLAKALQKYALGAAQMQRLEVLTAKSDLTKRNSMVQLVQMALGKTAGPARYQALGPMFASWLDSSVRSIAIGKRFTLGLAGATASALTRGRTVEMLEHALDEERVRKGAESLKARLLSGLLASHPDRIVLGTLAPIHEKMKEQFRVIHSEAYRDIMMETMKNLYERYGISFDMEKLGVHGLHEMGKKDYDVIRSAGIDEAKLARLRTAEAEIADVLRKDRSIAEKTEAVIALARKNGVALDTSVMGEMEYLKRIENSKKAEYVKLVELYGHIEMNHTVNEREQGAGKFTYTIGRERQLSDNELWRTLSLRRMVADAEEGVLHGNIKTSIEIAWLTLVNRLKGLGHEDVSNTAALYMQDLLTDEGKKEMKKRGGDSRVVKSYENLLYSAPYVYEKAGVKKPEKERFLSYVAKEGSVIWEESAHERGPLPGWWKGNMKGHWLVAPDNPRQSFTAEEWAKNRLTRAHTPFHDAEIESELDRKYPIDSKTWTPDMLKKRGAALNEELVKKLLRDDIHNLLNSQFADAYSGMPEGMNYNIKGTSALLAKMLKERDEKAYRNDIAQLEHLEVANTDHRTVLLNLLERHAAEFENFMKKEITLKDITRGNTVWIMTREGGFLPYVKNMPIGEPDRVLGGYAAIQDPKTKQWKRFDPDNVRIDFKGNNNLQMMFNMLEMDASGSSKKQVQLPDGRFVTWKDFMTTAREWANGQGFEGERIFNALLWKYAGSTSDWRSFWEMGNMQIKPKREVAPFSPNILRFFTEREFGFQEQAKPLRNRLLGLGDFVSSVSLAAGGPVHEASYAITPYSELYRQKSWKLAHEILTTDMDKMLRDIPGEEERRKVKKAFESVALAHGAYHQVWDYSIDRNPWRSSASYGAHQAWNTYFHFGPSYTYPVRANIRAFMSKADYGAFMLTYGWPMVIAQKMFRPYTAIFRGMQMAIQGYPSRWDQTFDPMRPWNYTSPRLGDFLSAMNPLNVFNDVEVPHMMKQAWKGIAKKDLPSTVSLDKINIWPSAMVERHLAGRAFSSGLSVSPFDTMAIHRNTYAVARTGAANPGASYYDYNYVLQLDPAMAEYLAYRGGLQSGFFQQMSDVRAAAGKQIVHRTVAAEARVLRSEQELRGFGVLQNPIFAWMSPVTYIWHSGFGILPFLPQFSPKEIATHWVQRARRGEKFEIEKQIKEHMESAKEYAKKRWQNPARAPPITVYCKCGTSGYRGEICKNSRCRKPLYGSNVWEKAA